MSRRDDFEAMIHKIQESINKKEENTYSATVIKHYQDPTHFKPLAHPTHTGSIKGPCGDTIRIQLEIKEDTIQDAGFWTDGCGASIACGDMLCSLILHKTITEAQRITPKELQTALDGLPSDHIHCSILAVNTLRATLNDSRV